MEKLRLETTDMVEENVRRIGELFPNCLTETKDENGRPRLSIDFEQLRQELSHDIVEGPEERYQFTWPDKRNAIRLANTPTNKTLRPVRDDETKPTGADSKDKPYCSSGSVNFDTTQNLYIEGDNLQVLKLLREDYLGKIKMIYIDPPYNTGNDFVYNDNFSMDSSEWSDSSGAYDEDGNWLTDKYTINTESNGRFHTDWLNMIYPRLKVAKDLLSEDGVIFISIDDREVENLIKVGNEIFGEHCFVANISWQKNYSPRNDSKGVSTEKESLVIYGRKSGWMPKKLPRTEEMNKMYSNPDNDPKGDWRNDNPCAPGARTHQGMVYAIQHPFTGEMLYPYNGSCWRYQQDVMLGHMNGWCNYKLESIEDADVRAKICGVDVKDVRKDVKAIVLKDSLEVSKTQAESVFERGQWPKFYFTKNGQGGIGRKTYLSEVEGKMVTDLWPHAEVGHTDEAKKELKALFDGDIPFDTPKPVRLLDRMVQIATDTDSIVLDFFSGSATTAHAVMQHNAIDGGKRKYILVQIPEKVENKYGNLCEIGKERIRRAGKEIKETSPLTTQDLDIGFRVLKLDSSNMEDVYVTPEKFSEGSLFANNIKTGRSEEDLLFQVMIEMGIDLSSKIDRKEIAGKTVWNVAQNYLLACFDDQVNETAITEIAKLQPAYFVMRDSSLANDQVADNFEQIWQLYSRETERRIL
jgi:adenine-specific DNA-methyltransferase